jgi:hypothetical protein
MPLVFDHSSALLLPAGTSTAPVRRGQDVGAFLLVATTWRTSVVSAATSSVSGRQGARDGDLHGELTLVDGQLGGQREHLEPEALRPGQRRWHLPEFMTKALVGVPVSDLAQPPGVVVARIDPATGLLPVPGGNGVEEFFLDGTAPTESAAAPGEEATPDQMLLEGHGGM